MVTTQTLVIAALVAGVAWWFLVYKKKAPVDEGFMGMPQRSVRVMREIHSGEHKSNLQNQWDNMMTDQNYIRTPSYQASLSPRFSNVGYGAHLRSGNGVIAASQAGSHVAAPPVTHLATASPRQMEAAAPDQSCSMAGGASPFNAGNYNDVLARVRTRGQHAISAVQVNNCDVPTDPNAPKDTQPILYDRYMFSPLKSRLHGMADPIRGDLVIPHRNTGWFSVSADPARDLHTGAMNVLTGANDNVVSMANLIYANSGNPQQAIGGVNMVQHAQLVQAQNAHAALNGFNPVPISQFDSQLSAAAGDLHVTTYM